MSREVLRHEEFQGIVELTRIRDFFLCRSLFLVTIVPGWFNNCFIV